MIDFRNINTVWASIITTTLEKLGLTTVIICPGSRSTPLTMAFSQAQNIESIAILDERSAAFFALGLAKKLGQPVAIVCTSGTASANFYPAIIEATESRVPLLILTADRPPFMRQCHSGQTIDQVKLYGHYPRWQCELSEPSLDFQLLHYLRQTIIYNWERSLFPVPGVVHLNIPFSDPLSPLPNSSVKLDLDQEDFFKHINANLVLPSKSYQLPDIKYERGIIIAGTDNPANPEKYVSAIASLSQSLNFPVLAEGLSPVRNYANYNPFLISSYDIILRNPQLAELLKPEIVLQIGDLPTSKILRQWLSNIRPITYIIDPSDHNFDSLHNPSIHLRVSVENINIPVFAHSLERGDKYVKSWINIEEKIRKNIDDEMSKIEYFLEGKIAWILSQILPKETPLFIANSMSVRNVEYFWKPNNFKIQPFFNRGANGIDGTLSTALGIAHRYKPSVLLTGDLALLHDTNGFLIRNKFQGHLTIILINNNGGGIFEILPIANFDPPFEEFFATPQDVNFEQLCATYNIEYELMKDWSNLIDRLNILPETGIRVLEIRTNRKNDAKWLKENLPKLANIE